MAFPDVNSWRAGPSAIRSAEPLVRGLYVQYGCGLCAPEGWLNFDASPRLRLERMPAVRTLLHWTIGLLFPSNVRRGNIVQGLPVPDGSVSAVYCSHVLEHLPRDDLPAALYNTLRILKPGGVFRLVVPDLYWRASVYLASAKKTDPSATDKLMSDCLLGKRTKPRTILAIARDYCGNSAHLWMYDFAALEALLKEAGFTAIRRCELGDGKDPIFARVEDRSRFFEGDQCELAIEAMKPTHRRPTADVTT